MTRRMNEMNPMIQQSLGDTVDYAKMRGLPITVFGTSSSGSYVDKKPLNPADVLNKYVAYTDLEVQCPHEDTIEALLALVRKWTTTAKGKCSKVAIRSVHVFWSMKEFWSTESLQERLSHPRLTHEIKLFQEVITILKQAGHQVYVSLYAGIPHIKENPCDETQLRDFEESVLNCLSSGGSDALVDNGLGFWTEHRKLWGEGEWFAITSPNKEQALSRVLDRYIMRQKTMLSLTVHKDFATEFENSNVLTALALKHLNTQWPEDGDAVPEQDQGGDEGGEEEPAEEDSDKKVSDELFKNTTIEKLAAFYELEGQGQQRFWIMQQPENCCYASFKSAEGRALCRKPSTCLFCCAKHTEEKDSQYGLFSHYSVAAVSLLAKKLLWSAFSTDKIFDFIYELDLRLTGSADLKKELSYYGAIRCTRQEVQKASNEGSLLNYSVEVTHNKNGTAFCRASMDPMNQVYAGWLVAIAGTARSKVWSNNRERLGDMVETALGFLKLTDEYVNTLGWLVGDPNSMSNRIEQSLRLFIDSDSQRFFVFGKGRPPKGKRQPRREEYKQ